jgi:hypothetical protein
LDRKRSTHGAGRNSYRIYFENLKGINHFRNLGMRRRNTSNKVDVKETECGNMEWDGVEQDREQLHASTCMKINLFDNLTAPAYSATFSEQPANLRLITLRSHPFTESFLKKNISNVHLILRLVGGLDPGGSSTNMLYMFLMLTNFATCPTHLILLDTITGINFGKVYKY